ncbi:PHP domain-containing protein, partial [filamentous cyanobacterium CCP5]
MVADHASGYRLKGWETREAQRLKTIFQTVNASSCPSTYNFHMHTSCSDGRLSPEELFEQAIGLGLKAFAITDHHNLKGYHRAVRWLEDWQWRHPSRCRSGRGQAGGGIPKLFVGVEITASMLDTDVHILGYGFDPSHDQIAPYLCGYAPRGQQRSADQVIQAIQSSGGLAVLAHPARYRRAVEDLVAESVGLGIQGVEAYYAYSNPTQWQPCPKQTPRIEALAH